jgi:hypothetical protein
MKMFRDEAGQTLVFTAFLMCCLFGFMAMAIDVGVLLRAQRRMQTAADAGAIAGGLEYFYHGTTNVTSVAKAAAGNNGVSDPNQVTVTIPPVHGWHTGAGYLEVAISQPNPTVFMTVLAGLLPGNASSNYKTVNVGARAVAGIVPAASCVYLLNQTDAGALTVKGNANVTSPNCTWTVDSTSPQAFCITGQNSDAQFNSPGVILAGGQSTAGNCNKTYGGAQTGGSSFSDPLQNLISFPDPTKTPPTVCDPTPITGNVVTAPIVTSATPMPTPVSSSTSGFTANQPYNIICFNAGAGVPTTLQGVTLGANSSAGKNTLYVFENGLVLSGTNTVYGTVDLNNGAFCQGTYNTSNGKCNFTSAGGGPSITIHAPANGDPDPNDPTGTATDNNTYAWNGMAFVVPPSNSSPKCDSSYGGISYSGTDPNSCLQMQFGSNSGQLDGMIYAPYSALYLQDSGGTGIGVTSLIVNSTFINGTLNITANYAAGHPESPLNHVALVE